MHLPVILVSALSLTPACLAALIGNWNTCVSGDTCNSGYICCIGVNDVATQKRTCRPVNGDCIATSVTSPAARTTTTVVATIATSNPAVSRTTTRTSTTTQVATSPRLIANWSTCVTGDVCNSGYTCCVGVNDLSTGKRTCRPTNGDCASTSGGTQAPASPTPGQSLYFPAGFKGLNTGIGSWFYANSHASSTNGKSWCGYPYKDYTNGFAPDIRVMTNGTDAVYPHSMWVPSATQYCGLEAIVTNPNTGVSRTMYIVDAFAHQWVRTPGSIDIMRNKFAELFGRSTSNHNDVIQGVQWRLTGRRSSRYAFGGVGDP